MPSRCTAVRAEERVDHGGSPFHEVTAVPGNYRLNLGCLDDIDPLALAITVIDGRAF